MEVWKIISAIIGFVTTYTILVIWCIRQEGKIKMLQKEIDNIKETNKKIMEYIDKFRDDLFNFLMKDKKND